MKLGRKRSVTIIFIIAVIMLSFSAVLTTMSYRKMQADTFVHSGALHTLSAVQKVNYALSFGKPLDKYYGLDSVMEEVLGLSPDILGIEVLDSEGETVNQTGEIPDIVRQSGTAEEYVIKSSGIYTFVPFDAGMIILRLDIERINSLTLGFIRYLLRILFIILLVVFIVSVFALSINSESGITVKRLRNTGVLILIGAQLVLGLLSILRVDISYQESVELVAKTVSKMVANDINAVIAKGIDYDELTGIDEYLQDLVRDIPELSDLAIGERASTLNNGRGFVLNIAGLDSDVKLSCYYSYNDEQIRRMRLNNLIDVLILVLITVFMSLEIINFLTNHMEKRSLRKQGELYLPGFRLFVFIEGIAFTLDAGFFSVLSKKMFMAMELPESLSFLSGMPNTMYSASVLIGLLSCSFLIRRFGMKRVLIAGVMAGVSGYILCAIALNLPMLILARFIFGFCDGLLINSIRLYASAQKDVEMHTKILVEYMSAINLGVSCGVVIGGLIADVASYTTVFLTGAILGAFCAFLVLFAGFPEKKENTGKLVLVSAVKELRIPRVLIYMIGVVVPIYIATLFVGYTFPLFGDESGLSNSMVAGCLMINYIIIAYMTDPIADRVIKRFVPETAMFFYMLLQAVSIGLFVHFASLWAAILALILTSLWDCFGMVVIDLGLQNVEGASTEHCTLLQMLFGKFGLVLGPVLITSGLSKGAAGATRIIVLLLFAGLILYMLSFAGRYRHRRKKQ